MFSAVTVEAATRLSEVRRILTHIKSVDSHNPEDAVILRGLFFVHLYGAFEYAINLSVQVLLQEISRMQILYSDFEHLFYAVALDPYFRSVADAGPGRKWIKRRELLKGQRLPEACELNDAVFTDQLQNLWFETLEELFEIFCISDPVVPDARLRGYVNEVVDNRNAVSHGRLSPVTIGRRFTSGDLELIFDAINTITNHVIDCFARQFAQKGFVAAANRGRY